MNIDFDPFPHRSTFKDLTGKRFGRWLVLKETRNPRPGPSKWHCRCDCGKEKMEVGYTALTGGRSLSCGCLRREFYASLRKSDNVVHDQRNPSYRIWQGIRTRCFNERHPSYRSYGERGITMCPQWKDNFDQFLKDMGPRPKGLSIERINNGGNYEPGNCQWGTAMEQAGNTRRNIVVEWNGVRCNLIDVARAEQTDYQALSYRYQNKGMSIEDAVADLKARGLSYHERAAEAGSTRKNKTDEKRKARTKIIEEILPGRTFGRWTVLASPALGFCPCRCVCGTERSVQTMNLIVGSSKSCGCLKTQLSSKPLHQQHGHVNPTYRSWHARRAKMPLEWRNNFDQFLKDMGPRPEKAKLVSGDGRRWDKETCEWRVTTK